MANNPPERAWLQARYFSPTCTCKVKRWPGFAQAVKDAMLDQVQLCRWFGIDRDTFYDWMEFGAPVPVHVALRAVRDLGFVDPAFMGWRVADGCLVAPNGRRLSLQRLSGLLGVS